MSISLKIRQTLLAAVAAVGLIIFNAPAVAADDHPAQEMVESAIVELRVVLENDLDKIKADPAYLKSRVDEIIVPNVDFNTMTKLAVGKFWKRANRNQKTELVTEFQTLLMKTYAGALTEYNGETMRFEPFRPEKRDDRAVVRSIFSPTSGSDVPVTYKLRDKNGWSIYDIEVNNISLVTSYRSAFSNEIEKGGVSGLLNTLKQRNNKS